MDIADSTSDSDSDKHSERHSGLFLYICMLKVSTFKFTDVEPIGFFDVIFAVPTRSLYRTQCSFNFRNQQDYLYYGDVSDDRTLNVRAVMDSTPNKYMLFPDNPLLENCYLQCITCGRGKSS